MTTKQADKSELSKDEIEKLKREGLVFRKVGRKTKILEALPHLGELSPTQVQEIKRQYRLAVTPPPTPWAPEVVEAVREPDPIRDENVAILPLPRARDVFAPYRERRRTAPILLTDGFSMTRKPAEVEKISLAELLSRQNAASGLDGSSALLPRCDCGVQNSGEDKSWCIRFLRRKFLLIVK